MNRRQILIGTSAIVAATAVPTFPVEAMTAPAEPIAEMFWTTDEPWGLWVRGHVTLEQYDRAALALIERDPDVRENTEEWLWDSTADDDGNTIERAIIAAPEHRYMRLDHTDDAELGDVYKLCDADTPGAIPITVVKY